MNRIVRAFLPLRHELLARRNALNALIRRNIEHLFGNHVDAPQSYVLAFYRTALAMLSLTYDNALDSADVIARTKHASELSLFALRVAEIIVGDSLHGRETRPPRLRFVSKVIGFTRHFPDDGVRARDGEHRCFGGCGVCGRRPIFSVALEVVLPPELGGKRLRAKDLLVRPPWMTADTYGIESLQSGPLDEDRGVP